MKLSDDHGGAIGRLLIQLFAADGTLKEEDAVDNLVVTAGKNWQASRSIDASQAVMSYMAIGTGVTAPALTDTTLTTEAARVLLDSATAVANVATYTATFPAGVGVGAICEAGLFNAGAGGTMLAHTTFGTKTKDASDYLVITWTVTQS